VDSDITRRQFVSGTAAGAVAMAAAGCGLTNKSRGETGTITWLNEKDEPATVALNKKIVGEYASKAGKVRVDTTPPGDTSQKVLNNLKSGQSYDLSTSNLEQYIALADDGYLDDLQELVTASGGQSAFFPNTLFAVGGRYYEFPYNLNMTGQYFRKDWLEEVGEELPRTWDQFVTVARKLTRGDRYGFAQPLATGPVTNTIGSDLLWSNRVEFFDADENVILDEPEMKARCVQCLELLQRLLPYLPKGMLCADYPNIIDLFVNAQVGIAPYGSLDGRALPAAPGPLTTTLERAYAATWTDPRYSTPLSALGHPDR
jgi:multiple sugar transport system substrate-binding protein